VSGLIAHALRAPTHLSLFNALFALLCAPGSVLGPCFEKKTPSALFDTPDQTVNAALRHILMGREQKAMKSLFSNGVAPINDRTVDVIKKMHPQRPAPLVLPAASAPQLELDEKTISDRLFNDASNDNLTKDVFGWAAWLLFPWRGEEKGVFKSLCEFCCYIANNSQHFPPVCAVLLGAGALTPLNKLNAEEQAQYDAVGLDPKLRPINSGSMFTKAILGSALDSPEGRQAAQQSRPYQLSLGTPRGIEKLIHSCRAAEKINF
jgi:hypothetical protein